MEESHSIFPGPEDDSAEEEEEDKTKIKLPSLMSLIGRERETKDRPKEEDKERAGEAIAHSLLSKINNARDTETAEHEDEALPGKDHEEISEAQGLTPEEEAYINVSIAEEHLQNPVTEGPPSPPVTEFLDKIIDGIDPDEAFAATSSSIAWEIIPEEPQDEGDQVVTADAETLTPGESVSISEHDDSESGTETDVEVDERDENGMLTLPAPAVNPLEQSVYASTVAKEAASGQESKRQEPRREEPSHIAKVITKSLIEKRNRRKTMKSKENTTKANNERKNAKQITRRVTQIEGGLTRQENTLQHLSQTQAKSPENVIKLPEPNSQQEQFSQAGRVKRSPNMESRLNLSKPNRANQIGKVLVDQEGAVLGSSLKPPETSIRQDRSAQVERIQVTPNMESRLNLSKPNRANQIGKVLVDQERASSKRIEHNQEDTENSTDYTPDRVKTMLRPDLLKLSDKINVEGASLRHMFDNHLFGEGALRRLVEAHLLGKELLPLVKHEIIEKQIDFERYPGLRDKQIGHYSDTDLSGARPTKRSRLSARKQNEAKDSKRIANINIKLDNLQHKPQHGGVFGATIAVTITVIIVIIIYLLFR